MVHIGHIEATASAPPMALTADVRCVLEQMTTGLDARFMTAGEALARALETSDRVVQALCKVGQTFAEGEAGAAIDGLTDAAQRLTRVPEQQRRRAQDIAEIRGISTGLANQVGEVAKALEVLRIYGVNVKIAASGASEFLDFADRMQGQLADGEDEIKHFGIKLTELEAALGGIEEADKLLSRECAKVLPEVPDRLIGDAAALRNCQDRLAQLASSAQAIAQAIQGNAVAVLGAIQIGDITRQRLEHVLHGCALLDDWLAQSGGADHAAVSNPMLHLLAAQLADTNESFCRETALLVQSLRSIIPDATRLLGFNEDAGSLAESRQLMRRVEAGIAEADAMTARLREADGRAESITDLMPATVDELAIRARAVRNLRIDVQQMAINIGLRCRQVDRIGRPIAVIANEIRAYSNKLDAVSAEIDNGGKMLGSASLAVRKRADDANRQAEYSLTDALNAIGQGARHTEAAMASAGAEASEIATLLRDTSDELNSSLAIGATINELAQRLSVLAGPDATELPHIDGPLAELVAGLARTYTMAAERKVHACLVPQDEAPGTAPHDDSEDAAADDDADALF